MLRGLLAAGLICVVLCGCSKKEEPPPPPPPPPPPTTTAPQDPVDTLKGIGKEIANQKLNELKDKVDKKYGVGATSGTAPQPSEKPK